MFYFILGVLSASLVYLFLRHVRRQQIRVKWWGWLLSSLWLLYTLFVVAMTYSLITESAGRAASVFFMVFGNASVITAVLLARFVFFRVQRKAGLENRKRRKS